MQKPKKFHTHNKQVRKNNPAPDASSIRLNKYIAQSGICSRREADNYILKGKVEVNGATTTQLGTIVSITDEVLLNGKKIIPEKNVYVLINKPKGFVTTLSDPHARDTVIDLVKKACKERIYPVGRLDKNTTGLLLLTNDGDLTKKLTHPKYEKLKIYHAFLDKNLEYEDLNTISKGLNLEDGFIKPDEINYTTEDNKKNIGIELHSGRNRIVRRMFEHLGYKVIKLDRVYFAGLTKKNLPRGKWRYLTGKEIAMLKMGAYK
jgi:23S rRNA pseudouridine2605 synthase